MNTRWENWQATFGQLSAEYQAEREWAEENGMRLDFHLYIQFDAIDRFYVRVSDWAGMDVVDPKIFGSLEEAIDYLSDVDCEKFTDEQWEEFQKMI
ncbi:hypothetical protein [uncultured Porphyromonas sp.]|jgi:hypothetical protein|uniref:hypothetical protein n=1 Tax=uncultured Porphyromonas sp. TaxID=159274 RepID=UPI0027DE2BED|nr:hypothetical protein [uncultured Porphyromonas sp.]